MGSATPQPCRLLRVPAEARLRIYQYLFYGAKVFLRNVYDTKEGKTSVTTHLASEDCHKSVLFICKQVYIEAKRILADSILLTITSNSRSTSPDLRVPYPDRLTEYLLRVRELRLEDRNPCKLKIDKETVELCASINRDSVMETPDCLDSDDEREEWFHRF